MPVRAARTLVALCLARAAHAIEVDLEPPVRERRSRAGPRALLDQVPRRASTRASRAGCRRPGSPCARRALAQARRVVRPSREQRRRRAHGSATTCGTVLPDRGTRFAGASSRPWIRCGRCSRGPSRCRSAGSRRWRPTTVTTSSSTVTLQPLSVEDIEEGEGWLSGEVETTSGTPGRCGHRDPARRCSTRCATWRASAISRAGDLGGVHARDAGVR